MADWRASSREMPGTPCSTIGLVKSHFPEADLDPVGDGVPPDCSDKDWEANRASVRGIAERIVADLDL